MLLTQDVSCSSGGRPTCLALGDDVGIDPIVALSDSRGRFYILDGNQRAFCCLRHGLSVDFFLVSCDRDADDILQHERSGLIPPFTHRDFLMGATHCDTLLAEAKNAAKALSYSTVAKAVSRHPQDEALATPAPVADHPRYAIAPEDKQATRNMAYIAALEGSWGSRLGSDDCPPILGLAPLSVDDEDKLTKFVSGLFLERDAAYRFDVLLGLTQRFPAVMALWLARKAGEAYEYGAFWKQFSEAIAFDIPANKRELLSLGFQVACRRVLPEYIRPPGTGARIHVKEFLFQAGLPLCHCHHFARHMRKCERRSGLPDPLEPHAGEYLRDLMVDSMRPEGLTVLKRALQSEAGHYLCDVALKVVLSGSFSEVNPVLGEELSRAFQNQTAQSLRRAARQPFMRLAHDLCSLEIVGPRQDHQIVEPSGLHWVINGQAYRHPYTEEFVFPIQDESRVAVELRGLRNSQTLLRTFVVDIEERGSPFIVFDAETRRVCVSQGNEDNEFYLNGGQYCVLHPEIFSLSPCTETYPWPDGKALSFLDLRPGRGAALSGPGQGRDCRFLATLVPYFEIPGQSLLTDDGIRIHYGVDCMPLVWVPRDEIENLQALSLSIANGIDERVLTLEPNSVDAGAWIQCRAAEGAGILDALRPGVHQVEIVLRKSQRIRGRRSLLYWSKLDSFRTGGFFQTAAPPQNLVMDQCRNFTIAGDSITHAGGHARQATLAFDVCGNIAAFHWSREGTFLESVEKRPGRELHAEPCVLGSVFSASPRSRRWLRLWPQGDRDVDVRVNGRPYAQLFVTSRQRHIDLSLATIALANPRGGSITLHSRVCDVLEVATFSPPLIPERVEACGKGASLIFTFPDPVSFFRPKVFDVTEGVQVQGYEQAGSIAEDGLVFSCAERPTVTIKECSAESCSDLDVTHPQNWVKLEAKADECSPGVWLLELEARRTEDADWQLITTAKGKRLPALFVVRPPTSEEDFRSTLIWSALDAHGSHVLGLSPDIFAENEFELPDLLSEVFSLIDRGFGAPVRPYFYWLENLCHDLSQEVSRTLGAQDADEVRKLIVFASGTRSHSGFRSMFVNVPGLLALPSGMYYDVPKGDPLPKALHWCAQLSESEQIVEKLQDTPAEMPDIFQFMMHFENAGSVLMQAESGDLSDDFSGFDYCKYWDVTVGTIDATHTEQWDFASPLDSSHAKSALSHLLQRREAGDSHDSLVLGQVTRVLCFSEDFRQWLRQQLSSYDILMPDAAWSHPWLRVALPDDCFVNNCAQFASVFALALRASGTGWLEFDDVLAWLRERSDSPQAAAKTIAALVGMAPELFGYYLMFWELMIRTYPHA
ncbi:MAG: hypothetical protein HN341_10580 [Verrucomicrobia bacterium]|nr:hypothetical protein [Verrucomicrobiota bacterium]